MSGLTRWTISTTLCKGAVANAQRNAWIPSAKKLCVLSAYSKGMLIISMTSFQKLWLPKDNLKWMRFQLKWSTSNSKRFANRESKLFRYLSDSRAGESGLNLMSVSLKIWALLTRTRSPLLIRNLIPYRNYYLPLI